MSEGTLGEITMFGGNFAPRGWAFCSGQLMPISQNTSLFSILGTTYGGDGRTTFALPDMRGRVPLHPGAGPGLSTYSLGQKGGTETETLTVAQMPAHTHGATTGLTASATLRASGTVGDTVKSPAGNVPGFGSQKIYSGGTADTAMDSSCIALTIGGSVSIGSTGGGQAHNNMQPYLGVNFIIAVTGVFPSRN
ncbi:MAG: tail fiber protein [Planctomycetota bacterium]